MARVRSEGLAERAKAICTSSASVAAGDKMQAFRASGTYRIKKGNYRDDLQVFKIEVAAEDENAARDLIFSNFGSRFRVLRKDIAIKELVTLKPDEITDPVVEHQVGGGEK
jgi:ribosomal protein L20A (L18A)